MYLFVTNTSFHFTRDSLIDWSCVDYLWKYFQMEIQPFLHLGWPEGEDMFSKLSLLGELFLSAQERVEFSVLSWILLGIQLSWFRVRKTIPPVRKSELNCFGKWICVSLWLYHKVPPTYWLLESGRDVVLERESEGKTMLSMWPF